MDDYTQEVFPIDGLDVDAVRSILFKAMFANPFSRWSYRVDVFLDGHLPPEMEPLLHHWLNLNHRATAEFTKRPGVTKQTWVTIIRPDPTKRTMDRAVFFFEDAWNNREEGQLTFTLPFHLPERVDQEFCYHVRRITGGNAGYEHKRFKRHQVVITVTPQ